MPENISPEERLLKHIRTADNGPKSSGKIASGKAAQDEVMARAEALSFTTPLLADKQPSFLRDKSFILVVMILVLAGYIAYQFLLAKKDVSAFMKESQTPVETKAFEITVEKPTPFSVYAQKFDQRDIFEPSWQKVSQKKTEPSTASVPDIIRNFKLVGIILDENPQAILEDSQVRETLFLHKGDNIKGLVIEDIQEGKVTLSYEDQKYQLTP